MINSLEKQQQYEIFLEELKAIITEKLFNSRLELIQCKWELGKRVLEEEKNLSNYGDKVVEKIAEDIKMSSVGLWKCIQFYKKYPQETFEEVVSLLPEGKNISWYQITTKVLPEHKDEKVEKEKLLQKQELCPHLKVRCANCKKELTLEELKKL